MSIDDLGMLPPLRYAPLQVVAERVGTVDHLLVHPADDGLLLLVRDGLIKLGQAGLAVVVDDQYTLDHIFSLICNSNIENVHDEAMVASGVAAQFRSLGLLPLIRRK